MAIQVVYGVRLGMTDVTAATPDDATALTARAIAKQRTTPEGQEGLRAFLERRPAGWHDR